VGTKLLNGEADAAILIFRQTPTQDPAAAARRRIRLMDFSPEAEAYTNRFADEGGGAKQAGSSLSR